MHALLILLEKAIAYGCIGILIEVFFTGVASLIQKDWDGTAKTYLWMFPIYGVTALFLEGISNGLDWPFYLKAFVLVPVIYGTEALSGWTIKKITGRIPWHYPESAWSPAGLINLKYAPFWLLLAMAFDPITAFLTKMLHALSIVTS